MCQVFWRVSIVLLSFLFERSRALVRHGQGSVRVVLDQMGASLPFSIQDADQILARAEQPPESNVTSELLQAVTTKQNKIVCLHPFKSGEMPPDENCPVQCPFVAEMETACMFQCVGANSCAAINHEATIADHEAMVCRGCEVEACEECAHNGEDVCKTCSMGYKLLDDGSCEAPGNKAFIIFVVVFSIIALVLLVWLIELMFRPIVNEELLEHGFHHRWRSRLFNYETAPGQAIDPTPGIDSSGAASLTGGLSSAPAANPSDDSSPPSSPKGSWTRSRGLWGRGRSRTDSVEDKFSPSNATLWPLSTNLCRTSVAGPGVVLYFNFQFMVIVWIIMVMLGWSTVAVTFGTDLFKLGIQEAETARQLCDAVLWGHDTQKRLMGVKVAFMLGLYVFSTSMFFVHAILQHRRYRNVDFENTTLEDFAAVAVGLPEIHGSELAENHLKQSVEAGTGEKVVGVSVCWNFRSRRNDVTKVLEYNMRRMPDRRKEPTESQKPSDVLQEPQSLNLLQRGLRRIDNAFVHFWWGWDDDEDPGVDCETLVKDTASLEKAFIVFETERSRDAAITTVKRMPQGLQIDGRSVQLVHTDYEPESVNWANFGFSDRQLLFRFLAAFVMVLVGLVAWAIVIYVPYAYYFASYPYSQGGEPAISVQVLFTIFVVVGLEFLNAHISLMSEWIGFRLRDHTETCFLVLYSGACFISAIMDLVISCLMVYWQLVKGNAVTASGKLVVDLSSWKEVFESYPMQKALGMELFFFAFPACFLAPFVLEPILKVGLPMYLGKLFVRSRPEMDKAMAEKCLRFTGKVEVSRYADILFNMLLAIIMFAFPGGYVMITFGAMLGSHIFIYLLDQWTTLRAVTAFTFSSNAMDVTASAMMSVPCGLLLVITIFKFHNLQGMGVGKALFVLECVLAFLAHIVLHVALIVYVAPKLGQRAHLRSQKKYADAASTIACSWFTANPMHCLRSKYLHNHEPPATWYVEGKEHLIHPNAKIGIYFAFDDS